MLLNEPAGRRPLREVHPRFHPPGRVINSGERDGRAAN
jgi:hypothetical protein